MKRSERLFRQGLVEVDLYGLCETVVIIDDISSGNLKYIATDFDTLCDGQEVTVDIYEDLENNGVYLGKVNF